MNKFHIIVIVLFGFLLMPSSSFACENNSAKHSSQKAVSSNTCNEDCCKNDGHSKNKKHQGCGKCNHSNCGCASTCNSSVSINEWYITTNCFNFSSEKPNFYNYETAISSGFNSLWLIPKIS
ncbi:hypothetical protein [Flavobacterium gilvum]|uniref:Lipoprotein n=1 Tax=Flavobacterium gilvum TaxID=1492737 RepID=A0AAC9I2E3_9FLAO|nr:hypothetical protein [Flavobacterium gilvum]AOW08941.1 hypothetical protein EM308_05140 [Flavobacterium gilvum]